MTNFAKFGSNEPLEGGSTAIFACNHAKPLSSMFFYQMPTFLTPGKVIGNKKVFSLHPNKQLCTAFYRTNIILDYSHGSKTYQLIA